MLTTPEVNLDIVIPEVPVVIVTEVPTTEDETVNADYEQTQGDMMKMEDDIEKEIAFMNVSLKRKMKKMKR